MEISKAEYQRFVQDRAKKSPLVKDCAMAFGIGGGVRGDWPPLMGGVPPLCPGNGGAGPAPPLPSWVR